MTHTPKQLCKSINTYPSKKHRMGWISMWGLIFPFEKYHRHLFQNGSSGRVTHQQPRAGNMREYLLLKEGTMISICIYKIMNRNAILADCSDQHLQDMTISIGLYVNRHQGWISTPKRLQNLAV